MDGLQGLATPTISADTGTLIISVIDDQIKSVASGQDASIEALGVSSNIIRSKVARIVSGLLSIGETQNYGSGCKVAQFMKINPSTQVASYSLQTSPSNACATFTVPYSAIPASAKSLATVMLQGAAISPINAAKPANTTTLMSSQFAFNLIGTSSEIVMSGLTGDNRITISAPVTDGRECNAAVLDPASVAWTTADVTCSVDSLVIADANPAPQPGTISIKTAGNGTFTAFQGILDIKNDDSASRATYRTCMIAANFVSDPTAVCKTALNTELTTSCTGCSQFHLTQELQYQMDQAATEERDYRTQLCYQNQCSISNCPSFSCSACTTCKDDADSYYNKVRNPNAAESTLDALLSGFDSALNTVESAMDSCMASASSGTERASCISTTAKNQLQAALGGNVDDQTLNEIRLDYIY